MKMMSFQNLQAENTTHLQDDPDDDHSVGEDVACHKPVDGPVLVEARQCLWPGVAGGDVEEGDEGLVEHLEVVWRYAAEERHRDNRD